MPSFSNHSLAELATVRPELRLLASEAIKLIDFRVQTGRRGRAAQGLAYGSGNSKARWPDSAHNCPIIDPTKPRAEWLEDPNGLSRAFDVIPMPLDWADPKPFLYLAGVFRGLAHAHGIAIKLGADWDMDGLLNTRERNAAQLLNDLPHIELVQP